MSREQDEIRVYVLEGVPSVLRRVERLLALMAKCGAWGSSRNFMMWFDGDGADRLSVRRILPDDPDASRRLDEYDDGAGKAIESGYGVISVNGPGFLGMSGEEPKKRWKDSGEEVPVYEPIEWETDADGVEQAKKPKGRN